MFVPLIVLVVARAANVGIVTIPAAVIESAVISAISVPVTTVVSTIVSTVAAPTSGLTATASSVIPDTIPGSDPNASNPGTDRDPKNLGSDIGTTVETQAGAPWGLARISHTNYTFNPDGSVLYSDPNNAYYYRTESDPANVTVYMLDSGINVDHEQFEGRASWGTSFVTTEGFNDGNGHGTHLAGLAIGKTVGVARNARLVAVKVLDSNRVGSVDHFVNAVDWVISHHDNATRGVINYSAVGDVSEARANAITKAIEAGLFVVTAAGNSHQDACNYGPANTGGGRDGQLVVAALNYTNEPASFSNTGHCVDVYAPGVNILSSLPWSSQSYGYMDGTSNAAAFVSGLIAYFWGLDPDLSLNNITSLVINSNPNAVLQNAGDTSGTIVYNYVY